MRQYERNCYTAMIPRNHGEKNFWGVTVFQWWIRTEVADPIRKQRGQLLNLFLLAGILYSGGLLVNNLLKARIALPPQQVSFLVLDIIAIGGSIILWRLNRMGHVRLASLVFLACTCLFIAIGFPPELVDRAASLYALPIMISSFVWAPATSILLAVVGVIGYSIVYACNVANGILLPYNYITIPALLILAIASWLIASRLEHTLQAAGEAKAELQTLVEQIAAVIYITALDEHSNFVYISSHVVSLFGYTLEEWSARPRLWSELLHPGDRQQILAKRQHTQRSGDPFCAEYRMLARDGHIVWVHDDAVLVRDETGRPSYCQGVLYDITASKLIEQALAYERDLLRALMDNVPDTIYIKDTAGRFIRVNRAQAHILGIREPTEAIGKTDFDFFSSAHAHAAYEDEQHIIATGQPVMDKMEELTWPDGQCRWVSATKAPLFDQTGQCLGIVGISRDVHDRKKMEDKLKYMSIHDALTGLYNRAFFDDALMHLEQGQVTPLTIIMADIDRLKEINDFYGHNGGDEILRQTAALLRLSFRSEDVIARIGGDEFAVLLPGVGEEKVQEILQRLQQLIEQYNTSHPGPSLGLSIGAASAQPAQALSEVLKSADEQMYRVKPARLSGG